MSEEQQRRIAAVIALIRELADASDLDHLVSVLLQAAAVWYDLDGRGFRRGADGTFSLAAVLPGAAASDSARALAPSVASQYQEVARITASHDLEAFGWREASGDLIVLPLPSGADPLWMLTFAGGFLGDAEPVLRGLSPLLDVVIDRSRLKHHSAVHAGVVAAMSRAFESGESPVSAGLDTLRRAVGAAAARLSLRSPKGDIRVVGSAGTMPPHREAEASRDENTTVTFAVGRDGTAILELGAAPGGAVSVAAFADVGRSVFLPWLSGALTHRLAGDAEPDVADLTPRIRDEIANAARFGRGTAVLSIAFVPAASGEPVAMPEVRRRARQAISGELRRDDAVGRIDGADLAVLVTDVTPDALPHASERVRRILASAHLAGRAPAAVIGTAVFPADGIFADQLMDVARSHAARQLAAINEPPQRREQA